MLVDSDDAAIYDTIADADEAYAVAIVEQGRGMRSRNDRSEARLCTERGGASIRRQRRKFAGKFEVDLIEQALGFRGFVLREKNAGAMPARAPFPGIFVFEFLKDAERIGRITAFGEAEARFDGEAAPREVALAPLEGGVPARVDRLIPALVVRG